MADWVAIKTEYVTTNTSYRKLAEKYGINKDSIAARAKAENWQQEKRQQTDNIQTKAIQKTTEAIAETHAERIALLMAGGAKAAQLLMRNLENMEASGEIRPYEIKATIDAMKGIKELYKADDKDAPDDDNLNAFLEGMKHA